MSKKFSRRDFLKGATASAAMVAAGGLLTACSQNEPTDTPAVLSKEETIEWNSEYDVVVCGFGGAGASAAITAAEEGAKVLLLEKAIKGEEGGNTRVCGQLILHIEKEDRADAITYMKALRGGYSTPEDAMIEKYVDNVMENRQWLVDHGVATPIEFPIGAEYPEYDGAASMKCITVDGTVSSGALYNFLHKQVDANENIDVWYNAPAVHLIQDPETKIVYGVEAEVDGQKVNVRAKNGVVLTTGGFENNMYMIQNYLQMPYAYAKGARFNTGDGVRMGQEAGAELWHMSNIAGPDMNAYNPATDTAFSYCLTGTAPSISGAGVGGQPAIIVGPDGTRFLDETFSFRHGHMNFHGTWKCQQVPDYAWLIFDDEACQNVSMYTSWSKGNTDEIEKGWILKADSIEELAGKAGIDAASLSNEVKVYNQYCADGNDPFIKRSAEYLKPIVTGPFYALKLVPSLTNTQGGPRRNENCEIMGLDGNPIPHLYSAGELGSLYADIYQGTGNIGECLAMGRVAGRSASAAKTDNYQGSLLKGEPFTQVIEDVVYETAENQYIGTSRGMNGDIVVRVTMDGDTIANVEVLAHTETPSISDKAIEQIPAAIVAANSTEVDVVSGATFTSQGICAAVNDALSQVK